MAWGLSVFVAVFVTGQFSGAHLNPAVTLGLAIIESFRGHWYQVIFLFSLWEPCLEVGLLI